MQVVCVSVGAEGSKRMVGGDPVGMLVLCNGLGFGMPTGFTEAVWKCEEMGAEVPGM